MVSALPEGIAAGDYTTSAEDKPALAVTESTARAWGGRDVTAAVRNCDKLKLGQVSGAPRPATFGTCTMPKSREYPDSATLFAAIKAGQVNTAWTTTAAPNIPTELLMLSDRTSLIRAENVVPLYRRNELNETSGACPQRGRRRAGHCGAGRYARSGRRRQRSGSGRQRLSRRTPARRLTHALTLRSCRRRCCAIPRSRARVSALRAHPRHHRREQPLVSRAGEADDQVQRLGVGADEHPGLVLADPSRMIRAAFSGEVLASFLSKDFVNSSLSTPSTAVMLRAMLVLMPPGCTVVTLTGWPAAIISCRSASVKPRTANFAAL